MISSLPLLLVGFAVLLHPTLACTKVVDLRRHFNLSGRKNLLGSKTGTSRIQCPSGLKVVDFSCTVERKGFVVKATSVEEDDTGISCTIRNNNRGRSSATLTATLICDEPDASPTAQCDKVAVRKRHYKVQFRSLATTTAMCEPGTIMIGHDCPRSLGDRANTVGEDAIFDESGVPIGIRCSSRHFPELGIPGDITVPAIVMCAPESVLDGVRLETAVEQQVFRDVAKNDKAMLITANCPEGTKVLASECIVGGIDNKFMSTLNYLQSGGLFNDDRAFLNLPTFQINRNSVRCSMVKMAGVRPSAALTSSILCVDEEFPEA